MTRRSSLILACLGVLLLPAAACPDSVDEPLPEGRPDPLSTLAGTNTVRNVQGSDARGAASRLSSERAPTPIRCSRGGLCRQLSAPISSGVDLLFVVDNSGSMAQEQASLREQFPRMIRMLTDGKRADGSTFPPAHDVHLGVVSTDMGLLGQVTNFPMCNTQRSINGGDDGLLQHTGGAEPTCDATYPAFLEYAQGRDDPEKLARDFGCIASLGTSGCGFEQPLESALKALWPKSYVDSNGTVLPPEANPVLFLSTTGEGQFGHGDTPPDMGGNAGFARNDPTTGLSLLAIVVVTDEDDCSSGNTGHFASTNDPANPLSKQGLNLRCFYNPQNLYALERYTIGYPNVRPNHQDTVRFAAIVGVPPDLVDAQARAGVDFEKPASVNRYYDRILRDARMKEVPQNENVPSIATVAPSCTRTDRFQQPATAYPPRRIVQVAKSFGRNGMVQSICQDDFGPAIDGLVDMMAKDVRAQCLPRPLKRRNDKVACDVIVEDGSGQHKLAQVPVHDGVVGSGEGFYYDDFSDEKRIRERKQPICGERPGVLITFTDEARPPADARVYLDCDESAQD
ncbi:MAG TPA: hypothetical protein VJV78_05980 [Polyangiales bacterium]|nr:hypothetical protein [Polyangiales bacterium]